jgi:uncharacterized protein (DUF2235 family)
MITPFSKSITKLGGLMFGWGLRNNVIEAYSFLMEQYEAGDRIFLFGFSRGAYTVRVLAALIHQAGLLRKGAQNLIAYAWETYRVSYKRNAFDIARRFRATYSREIDIHFHSCPTKLV